MKAEHVNPQILFPFFLSAALVPGCHYVEEGFEATIDCVEAAK